MRRPARNVVPVERLAAIAAVLAADPHASANEVYRLVGGRRERVLWAVQALRAAGVVPTTPRSLPGRRKRFPSRPGGGDEAAASAARAPVGGVSNSLAANRGEASHPERRGCS